MVGRIPVGGGRVLSDLCAFLMQKIIQYCKHLHTKMRSIILGRTWLASGLFTLELYWVAQYYQPHSSKDPLYFKSSCYRNRLRWSPHQVRQRVYGMLKLTLSVQIDVILTVYRDTLFQMSGINCDEMMIQKSRLATKTRNLMYHWVELPPSNRYIFGIFYIDTLFYSPILDSVVSS